MDIAAFKLAYPVFAQLPDAVIQAQVDVSACYLSAMGCGCDTTAEMLMVSHLLRYNQNAEAGGAAGQVISATIDKVSVSMAQQPTRGEFAYWLGTTPYGMQLLALLRRCFAGGLYVGSLPERSAFRSVGGRFPRRGRVF